MSLYKTENASLIQWAGAAGTGIMPQLYPIGLIGDTLGLVADIPTDKAMAQRQQSKFLNIIPGVGNYRLMSRRKKLAADYKGQGAGTYKPVSQTLGSKTSVILLALLGAAAGGLIERSNKEGDSRTNVVNGILTGLLAGAGTGLAANGLGALTAATTKTRNKREQMNYQQTPDAWNYIVPGFATYNKYKSYGHMMNSEDYNKTTV